MSTLSGTSTNSTPAVSGSNTGGCGVFGTTSYGAAVQGNNTASSGGLGVYGTSNASGGHGVFAEGNSTGMIQGNTYATANGLALYGWACQSGSSSSNNIGVRGDGDAYGLYGYSSTGTGAYITGYFTGVAGYSNQYSGTAGYFIQSGGYGYGVYGSGAAYGVYSAGPACVTGYLNKSGGGYLVDHPGDPANKLLNHCFVESPDMKNVYDGVVALDKSGAAVVAMPSYFEVANSDFRYQLTSVGGAAPNLHVSSEIANGKFSIAGGVPGGKVSWQVTGIRADKWALANHPGVEITKKEPGTYMHPELFGFDNTKHIHEVNRGAPGKMSAIPAPPPVVVPSGDKV